MQIKLSWQCSPRRTYSPGHNNMLKRLPTNYEEITSLQPDVILMDIQMPQADGSGINGIEANRQIVSANPHIGIITPPNASCCGIASI